MGGLFAKSNRPKVTITEQDKAVLSLKQQRDKIKVYQKKLLITIERDLDYAKVLLRDGKKSKALLLLKKKKTLEVYIQRTDGQLEALEKMVQDIEFAQIQVKVVEGLKAGNTCLQKLHQILSIEDVQKVMDDTQEAIAYQKELDELISGGLSQEDSSEIEAELELILQGFQNESISMPDVPTEIPETPSKFPDTPAEKPGTENKRAPVAILAE